MPETRKKCALVLGNGAYDGEFVLQNPRKDAEAVATALESLKFRVTRGLDLTYLALNDLVNNFVDALSSERPDVALLYYSGHGLQNKDKNFLVPIDFNEGTTVRLIEVQDLIDRVSEKSGIQIILLDACRSNIDAKRAFHSKGIQLQTEQSIYAVDDAEPVAGLAEMKAPTSTFIAFAAAPGDVAYEGDESLSPFTEAFLKYVDVVDLPLSNLLSRVRQEVLRKSEGKQRTWDQSSLMTPFYFNPGSMFLFMGNALALLSFFLSLTTYSFVLISPERTLPTAITGLLLPLISLSIFMFGVQTVYARLHGAFEAQEEDQVVVSLLLPSLSKGIIGGYLGSQVAALSLTYFYYRDWSNAFDQFATAWINGNANAHWASPPIPWGQLALEMSVSTALGACVLGFCCVFAARLTAYGNATNMSRNARLVRAVIGSTIGGLVTGIICAPITMWYFSTMSRPKVMPTLLLPGTIFGAVFIVFSIVNFDFERLSARRLLAAAGAAASAIPIGGLVAAAVFGPLYYLGAVDFVVQWITDHESNVSIELAGGAIYGVPVGLTLGAIVGIGILLTERWSGKPVI